NGIVRADEATAAGEEKWRSPCGLVEKMLAEPHRPERRKENASDGTLYWNRRTRVRFIMHHPLKTSVWSSGPSARRAIDETHLGRAGWSRFRSLLACATGHGFEMHDAADRSA